MAKRYEQFPEDAWVRTCQECSNIQTDTKPQGEMTEAYQNRKCKKCKSEALDYGCSNYINEDYI